MTYDSGNYKAPKQIKNPGGCEPDDAATPKDRVMRDDVAIKLADAIALSEMKKTDPSGLGINDPYAVTAYYDAVDRQQTPAGYYSTGVSPKSEVVRGTQQANEMLKIPGVRALVEEKLLGDNLISQKELADIQGNVVQIYMRNSGLLVPEEPNPNGHLKRVNQEDSGPRRF